MGELIERVEELIERLRREPPGGNGQKVEEIAVGLADLLEEYGVTMYEHPREHVGPGCVWGSNPSRGDEVKCLTHGVIILPSLDEVRTELRRMGEI